MKKILLLLTLALSISIFASENNHMIGNYKEKNNEYYNLSEEQQNEYNTMVNNYRDQREKINLEVRSLNLDIKKETLKENPNIEKLNKLVESVSILKTKIEKQRLNFQIEMKKEFSIDNFYVENTSNHMGHMIGMHNNMNSYYQSYCN